MVVDPEINTSTWPYNFLTKMLKAYGKKMLAYSTNGASTLDITTRRVNSIDHLSQKSIKIYQKSYLTRHTSMVIAALSTIFRYGVGIDNANVVHIQAGSVFNYKEKQNFKICRKGNVCESYCMKWGNLGSERQRSHVLSHMQILASRFYMCVFMW